MPQLAQMGGFQFSVANEIQVMSGYFVLIALVLLSVYVSRIPKDILRLFSQPLFQIGGLALVIGITTIYGWIHGIMAALAFALIVSRSLRRVGEGITDYIPMDTNVLVIEDPDSIIIPENHRWFGEKIMGENPYLIREKEVRTTAIQDLSERSMGSSTVTR